MRRRKPPRTWLLAGVLLSWAWLAPTPGGGAESEEPYPATESPKGLQVQMVDDALALGIRHAALNCNLGDLLAPGGGVAAEQGPREGIVGWRWGQREFTFSRAALERLDGMIRPLSDRGVVVSLILLNHPPADPLARRILVHPGYAEECPNGIAAFNTRSEEGRVWLEAIAAFLAERWGKPGAGHGRVWNWIVGNEVNSHWFWSNAGRVTLEQFADDYLEAVRLVHRGVRRHSPQGRVFVSLEHHWNVRYAGGDEAQAFPARAFLEYVTARSRRAGDFDWHVAFHPYPENLFEPRTWLDRSATADWRTTPRITFRNLHALVEFLQRPELRCAGNPRRIILSEQGFHTPDGAEGEVVQAAGYCYAWRKVVGTPEIDAFILHRHVDHAHEGGLRLGLWTRREGSLADPDQKKMIHDVFRAAGTAEEEAAFRFALPIIGLTEWRDLQ